MKKIEKVKILFNFLMDLIIEEDEQIENQNPLKKVPSESELNDTRVKLFEAKKIMDKLDIIDEQQNIKFKEAREDLKKYNEIKKIINEFNTSNRDESIRTFSNDEIKKEINFNDQFITLTSQEIDNKDEDSVESNFIFPPKKSKCNCDNSKSEFCSDCANIKSNKSEFCSDCDSDIKSNNNE